MTRTLAAGLLLFSLSTPAVAKFVCPPGRFIVGAVAHAPKPLRGGLPLDLGAGRVELPGLCADVAAGRFHRPTGSWIYRVRARWNRCAGVGPVSLRTRFVSGAPYCTRLAGTLRLGGRRFRIVADRVPACGNGLRESGEQCDGPDVVVDCCAADCRVKPGCPVRCDSDQFPCDPAAICVHACGFYGTCRSPAQVDCSGGPVCACDTVTTYPDRCAAFAAGTGVAYLGACEPAAPRR